MARKEKRDTVSVMLAPNSQIPFDDERIPYPDVYASYKLDGIRCFCRAGELLTRNMLTQPNENLPAWLRVMCSYAEKYKLCFDMEMMIHGATHHGANAKIFNAHKAVIPPEAGVHVFDAFSLEDWTKRDINEPFDDRIANYSNYVDDLQRAQRKVVGSDVYFEVRQQRVNSAEDAEIYFKEAVEKGYEGIMLRAATGGYKQGRCGHKNSWMLKFKDAITEDAKVIEVVQGLKMKKGIERTRNAFGRKEQPTKNSDNYEHDDIVGAFRVRTENGVESEIMFAEGVADMAQRRKWWKERKSLIGRWLEFKSYPGGKDGLRSGLMLGWRDDKKEAEE